MKFYSDGSLKNMLDDFGKGNNSKHINITDKIFKDSLMIEFLLLITLSIGVILMIGKVFR